MLLDIVKKGSTDRSVVLRIIDSGDGTPETGVVFNTSGIDLWYRREGAAKTSITEATLSALTDAHSDGGFLHVGDGYYRLDLPDAAFATGANYVDVGGTVTGMVVIGGRVRLTNVDLEDAVRGGMTALPNAAAEASGGLPTLSAAQASNGTIQANVHRWLTGTPNALQSGRVDSYLGAVAAGVIAAASFAANALDAVWSTATRVLTAGTNIALAKGTGVTGFNDLSAAQVNAEVDAAIETYHLDHLLAATYDPASKPGASDALLNELVESDGGVARFTANSLEQAPSGGASAADIADAVWEEALADHSGTSGSTAEQLAAAGAAGDPWATALPGSYTSGQAGKILGDNLNATVSSRAPESGGNVAAIKAKTDNLPSDPADASVVAGLIAAAEAKIDIIDTVVDAIKVKTDLQPEGIKKNQALNNFEFFMVDSADHVTGKTGLTVTVQRSIDGGAFAAATNTPATEVANGLYKINLSAADLNGDVVSLKATATGADATLITIKTSP